MAIKNEEQRQRIGQRIAELRNAKGMTQQDVADKTGLLRQHISRIEAGKYAVTLEVIQAIAEALGMTVDIIDPGLQDLAPLKRLTP